MTALRLLAALLLFGLVGALSAQDGDGWTSLFNGKDTTGWKLRQDKTTVTRYLDAGGKVIEGATKVKLDQKELAQDAEGKEIAGARIVVVKSLKAGLGILRDGGKLKWPPALVETLPPELRTRVETRAQKLAQDVLAGVDPDRHVLRDFRSEIEESTNHLVKKANEVVTPEYLTAKRFLQELDNAGNALELGGVASPVVVDARGKAIDGAKVAKVGGRDAIVDKKGGEVKDARVVEETSPNPVGWTVEKGALICDRPHPGNDLLTVEKFTDFELHIEFQATEKPGVYQPPYNPYVSPYSPYAVASGSGVYLQGRYAIQVDDSYGVKPKLVVVDGKAIEAFDAHQCGAIDGLIAPSKNVAKKPMEWQRYEVVFKGASGEAGKVTRKARVTLIWNGEKVIDDAEISGPTGGALDSKVTEPGPLLLQGDRGKVAYRNIKIRPLPAK
jgi:hypothetical protein